MDGKILNSDGGYVAYIKADLVYDRAGRKLYALRGPRKFTSPVANLSVISIINGVGWLNKASERLFESIGTGAR